MAEMVTCQSGHTATVNEICFGTGELAGCDGPGLGCGGSSCNITLYGENGPTTYACGAPVDSGNIPLKAPLKSKLKERFKRLANIKKLKL